jgi:PAS domain S-box-containing protein
MASKVTFLSGGGEMGALTRAFDWSSNVIGAPETWPDLLKTTLRMLLTSNHPMFIWWGPDLIQFYNDAYRKTMGPERHPSALGQRGRECWDEAWDILGPQIYYVMDGKGAVWYEHQLVPLTRNGKLEEIWWTYSYSPIEDDEGIQGVLVICNDVTSEHEITSELAQINNQLFAEIAQREQIQHQQRFQLELLDELSTLTEPEQIAAVAFQMLSDELHLTRLMFAHIDDVTKTFFIDYAWHQADAFSVKGMQGTLAEFGEQIIEDLRNGKTVSIADIRQDSRTENYQNAYKDFDALSILVVPIIKDKRFIATLSVHSKLPHEWRSHEANLIKEIAERLWVAIERARAETHRIQAQRALLKHQTEETERLRSLFQQSPSFVAILSGPEHRYDIANDSYVKLIGFRDLVGKTVRDALPELQGQGFLELLDDVYTTGTTHVLKGRPAKLQRTPGAELEEVFIDVVYQPIINASGEVTGIFVEGNDVTAQHQVQRGQTFLLELADRLRLISNPEDIVYVASELLGNYLGSSRVVFAEIIDDDKFLIRKEWIQNGINSVANEIRQLNDFGPDIIRTLRNGQFIVVDDILLDPQTAPHADAYTQLTIRAHLGIPLIKNGQLVAILGVHKTVPHQWPENHIHTAREMAERTWTALENAQAQAELDVVRNQSSYVFNTMTEGFAVVDRHWNIVQMNAAGHRITGFSPEETIGRNYWDIFSFLVKDEWFSVYEHVKTTRLAAIVEHDYEYAGGEKSWVEIRIYPALDGGLAFFFRDINKRKDYENKLKEADRRKDEFLAMLAHELRNPLAPVSAAADLLRLTHMDEDRVKQTSEIIARQVKHMTGLIDDLMDVSRVTRGLISLEQETLDVASIVSSAIEQVRPLIEARAHRLAVHLPPVAAHVKGDQKRLIQVITNMLTNSVKYTPEGGDIVLSMDVQEEHVVLRIKDNGVGMAKEMVGRVFDLFAQAERTPDRSVGGLGIGLALVKSLVNLHHGTVTAHSNGVGLGSEFTIHLPLVKPLALPRQQASIQRISPSLKRLRLMVVDDNTDAADMLAMLLEIAGHDVVVENSSRRALERAQADAPDVFLLDIGLPDMDGIELAQHLRLHPATNKATLIAVTGYGNEQDRKNAADAGFNHHFVKPVDTEKLIRLLAKLNEA